MADYIYRQAAIDAVHKSIFDFFDICDDDEESPMTYKDERLLELNKAITTRIKAVPSADAVEVVRCKDCKWWRDTDHTCKEHSLVSPMGAEEFCSRGERKDGNGNG